MKKSILVLIMAMLCLSLVFVFASCGGGGNPDNGECTHEYGEWEVVTANTCVKAGLQKRTCNWCGNEETETIKAAHSFGEWTVEEEATCDTNGYKSRVCTVCGNDETETIVSEGHKEKITVEAKEPTADADGCTQGSECEICGAVISASQTLTKLGNIATADGVTVTKGEEWHSFTGNKQYMFDGKNDTAPSSPKYDYTLSIALKEGAYIYDVIVVCNGGGTAYTSGGASAVEDATRVAAIKITCFKDGKEIVSETIADASTIKTAKLEGVNTYIDTIEIEVTCGSSDQWGTAYIWEINAYGTAPLQACEVAGHDWGKWETTKEPICTEDNELTDGEMKRTCTVCGETEKEKIKAMHNFTEWGYDADGGSFVFEPKCGVDGKKGRECKKCYYTEYEVIPTTQQHNWSEWNTENTDCENGGEKTRTCTNEGCGKVEKETVPAGTHANITVEGYIAPTVEAEGSTGKTYCTKCNTVIAMPKKITKLVNHSSDATVGTTGGWAIDGSTGSKDTRPHLNDGNMNTGMTTYTAQRNTTHELVWTDAATVRVIKIYFSGDGTGKDVGHMSGNLSSTNPDTTITVAIFDASNKPVGTYVIKTKDATEYTITFEQPTAISKISLDVYVGWAHVVNIWEVEALSGGETTNDAYCSHEWSNWETTTEADCETTGLEMRKCSLCQSEETNVIDKKGHTWSEWEVAEGFDCANGGEKVRTCQVSTCGKTEKETIPGGSHSETETTGYVAPTTEAEGSTGTTTCKICGAVVSSPKVISKLVNHSKDATASSSAWVITPSYMNDGDMSTGVTGYGNAKKETTNTLTWKTATGVDRIVLYFNGDTTDKNLGGNITNSFPNIYNNTNAGASITVNIYGADGSVIKTESFNSKDLTEKTIAFDSTTEITKIDVTITHNWNEQLCVNIWEVEALTGGEIVEK